MSEAAARIVSTPTRAQTWWLAARPRTLTASLVPILVGLSIAPPDSLGDVGIALATIASALCIQVGVNFANDCFDAEAGIDTAERLGPLRAVQAGLVSAYEMKRAFVVVLALAALFAIPLIVRGGVPILAVGLVSMVCAWGYAGGPKPLASLGLGDAFVFLFFGVVPVVGTVYLQIAGGPGGSAFGSMAIPVAALTSIPIALLAVAILVVNNLRDIPTDRVAGKRTTAVRLGESRTRRAYELLVAAALVSPIALAAVLDHLPALVALLAAPLALRTVENLRARTGAALNASLGETARLQLVFGVLLGAGFLAAALPL